MATKHYTRRIARSQKRAQGALVLFNAAAEQLEREAQEQKEVHALLQGELEVAEKAYTDQWTVINESYRDKYGVITVLQQQAEAAGRRAQEQALKLRELFL